MGTVPLCQKGQAPFDTKGLSPFDTLDAFPIKRYSLINYAFQTVNCPLSDTYNTKTEEK